MDNLPKDIIGLIVNNSFEIAPVLSAISKDLYEITHIILPILRSWRLHVRAYRLSFIDYLVAFGSDDILAKIDFNYYPHHKHTQLALRFGNVNATTRLVCGQGYSQSLLEYLGRKKPHYNEKIIYEILIGEMYKSDGTHVRDIAKNYEMYGIFSRRPPETEEMKSYMLSHTYCNIHYRGATYVSYRYWLQLYINDGTLKRIGDACGHNDLNNIRKIARVMIPEDAARFIIPIAIEHNRLNIVKYIVHRYNTDIAVQDSTIKLANRLGYYRISNYIRKHARFDPSMP
jgi:hypothetical protein